MASACLAVVLGGCFTTELDPDAPGVFVCTEPSDCPSGLQCNGEVCTTAADFVSVGITNPEPNQLIDFATFGSEISVQFNSTLQLVPAGSPADPGVGFLRLRVDDETRDISAGDASAGLSELFVLQRRPGAHRMSLAAFRPDGRPYPNPESTFRALFWLDDGEPHVALFDPWPGQVLPLEAIVLQPTIHTLNFALVPHGGAKAAGTGHAHFLYDVALPECANDPECDCSQFGLTDQILPPPGGGGESRLSAATTTGGSIPSRSTRVEETVSTILRHVDHYKYRHPFVLGPEDELETALYCGLDPIKGQSDGRLVFDTVPVIRDDE